MIVLIDNSQVVCPHCAHTFAVRRKNGGGASYVKSWRTLPAGLTKIITIWLSNNDMINRGFDKTELQFMLQRHGLKIKDDPLNARVSELVGLHILESDGQRKPHIDGTTSAPVYFLDVVRASQILNNGGKL